ncbi:MAG: TlpA family protein disulfide reductase [Niabella sp.]
MHEKYNVNQTKNTLLVNNSFTGIDNKPVILFDTLKLNPAIIEFYFVGCKPCEEKLNYLKMIYEEFWKRELKIILICDGTASSYNQFIKHWQKNKYQGIVFLYDSDSTISEYNIEGYPTELMTDGHFIVKQEKGFGNSMAKDWLYRERFLINKILNREK